MTVELEPQGVQVGQEAPDFELMDDAGQQVKLSDFRGKKNVLLAFYPAAFSIGCHTEFCNVRDGRGELVGDDNVEVLGISVDSVWSIKAWKEANGFKNRFLADFWPHGGVAALFGAFAEKYGVAKRYTYLIDKQGVVRHVETDREVNVNGIEAWRKAIDELG